MTPARAPRISKMLPALLPLILIACAANDRHVSSAYVGRSLAGKTLVFIPPDTANVEAGNPADIWACFPRERSYSARAILSQEFNDAFMAGLDRYVDFVKPVQLPTGVSVTAPVDTGFVTYVRASTRDLPGFTYVFPARGRLAARGVEADLALAVGRLRSVSDRLEIISPKSGGSMQQPFLLLEGQYLIWDYAAGKPVGYGRFRPQIDLRGDAVVKDWMGVFDKAVKKVVDASPFKGPKWFRS